MHSLIYLLCTCLPLCKHLSSQENKTCPSKKKKRTIQNAHAINWYNIIYSQTLSLPGLWSITQVVVKTAALRRTGAYWGEKLTCGHIEPQEQHEEHFGPLLRIRRLPTCAQFAPTEVKQTSVFVLSFTGISSAWLCPTASLSHSDQTAMSPEIKRIDKD